MADTVRVAEAADPVAEAIVQAAVAGPEVGAIVREAADPVEGRADSDEADRATTAVERFAASAWTISNTLITKILTAFAGT